MTSQQRPERGHTRHVSSESRRVAMPRRSTKGPLDLDLDLSQPPSPALNTALPPSPAGAPPSILSPTGSTLLSPTLPTRPSFRTRTSGPSPRLPLDLSPLLRSTLYSPVPATGIANPFLQPEQQPAPDTDLATLLAQRRFRHAASRAADDLTSGTVTASNPQRIFELYHTRLACLVLTLQPDLAAKEAKPLSDLLARESSAYARPDRDVFLNQVPWALRLLLLRLQTLGSGDSRRAIMGLYALGSECRALANKAKNESDEESIKLWRMRLCDLGVRVGSELIEMGELETAKRHMATLSTSAIVDDEEKQNMLIRETLLWLRIGDVTAAKTCISNLSPSDSIQQPLLNALTSLCSADYNTALSELQSLHQSHPTNELISHNLAIAHLYSGDVTSASQILESLVSDHNVVFPALLFNLATVYELRTERARDRKLELVDRIADMAPEDSRSGSGNWERSIGEFKLT